MKQVKGILLVNLGTPDSYKTADVRKYLLEFLLDPRVIDIPEIPRQLLVRGIIAPFRAPKSANTYKAIWTADGSPLLVHGKQDALKLQQLLGTEYKVVLAMRYGNPSIEKGIEELTKANVSSIRVIPMFPQYASATTGSVHQKVMEIVSKQQIIPTIEFINSYPLYPDLISAFAEKGKQARVNEADFVIFSFHGLPERQIRKADSNQVCLKASCCNQLTYQNQYCYKAQCYATARAIAKQAGIPPEKYEVAFQSRLGKDPWIQPYTSDVVERLGKAGKQNVVVFCPAFVCDCLETSFEIGVEYAEEFKHAGGGGFSLLPGLNFHELWVQTLAGLSRGNIDEIHRQLLGGNS